MAPLPPREQRHPFLRYQGLEYTDADIADFKERMVMEHHDDASVVVFTSRAWGRLFDTRGPLLGGARRRLSWRQFILALGLHTEEEMESPGFARYWSESESMIPGKGDLHDYWRSISSDGDFLGPPPSYTLIRDPVLRLFHRMMAHSIAGRSQALEKILGGLTVIALELPIIDMAELVRLQISEDVPAVDEGDQAIPAPVQPPQQPPPPPPTARTMPQRMARLEEDVHEIRGKLTE
ncbi:hypothetical protein Tco_0405451, partial [Tanacetum coccineum]